MVSKNLLFFIALLFLNLSLVSAYGFGGGYYSDPMYYLNNPWIMFIVYFIFFFAIIYFTTNRSFKDPQVSAVVAGAMSLFIAMALGQKGYLNNYMGAELASWILWIAVLIAIGFSIKFAYETFGRVGIVATILILWIILKSINPYEIIPYQLLNDTIISIYEFITSWIGLLVLLLISAIILSARSHRRGIYARNFIDDLFGR